MSAVLIVDDDPDIAVLLEAILRTAGHVTTVAHTATEALEHARNGTHDVLLIDLNLPDGDGKDVVRHVRQTSDAAIIVVTAQGALPERIAALDAGADDLVLKPFEGEEIAARVRARLRRARTVGATESVLRFDRLEIDVSNGTVHLDGSRVHFTPTELQMLVLLARSANRLVTHSELYRDVWPDGSGESGHYVRVYIQQIRRKLGDRPSAPQFIATEMSRGYRWLPRIARPGSLLMPS